MRVEYWIGGLVVLLVVLLVLAGVAGVQEQKQWDAFAKAHNCKVVAKREGSTSTGVAPIIGGNGGVAVTTSSTPGQTAYLCDDGVTYWRNN
jgi:hypothetical protein